MKAVYSDIQAYYCVEIFQALVESFKKLIVNGVYVYELHGEL